MSRRRWEKGSYTIEASIYVPMMLLMIMTVLHISIVYYQESKNHEIYEGLNTMDAIQEFYIYQIAGEVWIDD